MSKIDSSDRRVGRVASRSSRGRLRTAAALVALAAVAAACGGRLSEDQIQAELRTDGVGGGAVALGSTGGTSESGTGSGVNTGGSSGLGTSTGGGLSGSSGASGSGSGAASGGVSTGGTGGGATGGGSTGGTGGGGGTADPGTPAPPAPAEGNGGATDVGVTETEIKIGNVTTLSGPVPGLFRGALVGTQAAYAYQNSLGGLHGRQFTVVSGDDGFDAGKNRSVIREMQDKVFAFSGSFSLFDEAGVSDMQKSGVLDVARPLSPARSAMPNHINILPFASGWPDTGCKYLRKEFGDDVVTKMAVFWGNQDAARDNAKWQRTSCEKSGWKFIYEREFQATESNFTADAVRMNNLGVQGYLIVFDVTGIARFMKSMQQQGFHPPLIYPSPAAYDSALFELAGVDATEGAIIGQNLSLYLGADAQRVPEIALFLEWMAKVDPSQKVDIFSFYGWLSGRAMVEAMTLNGPNLTRQGVLEKLQTFENYNHRGSSESANLRTKSPGRCEVYMNLTGGQFVRRFPAEGFNCDGAFIPFP